MAQQPLAENSPTITPQAGLDDQIVDAMVPLIEKSGHFEPQLIEQLQKLLKNKAAPAIILDLLKK